MTMGQSISTCLGKYADFSGRASRSEYWYFVLFSYIVVFAFDAAHLSALSTLVSLGLLLPTLGAGVRRLHDTERSGWWILVPIANLVFLAQPGTSSATAGASRRLSCPSGHAVSVDARYCRTCGSHVSS